MIFYIKVNDCPYTETAEWWYNEIRMKHYNTKEYYTTNQIRMQLDFEKIIEISEPVYTFSEVMAHIDLKKYLVEKDYKTGRPSYDPETLLRITLFAFMEHGYISLREIEKLCKTDIRFMWLLDEMPAPSHMTIDNFINDYLKNSIEEIFTEINTYIFTTKKVDLNHAYFDGSKMEANAKQIASNDEANPKRYMINDYLKGKRVNYFKPFQTLFVLATLYLILAHFLDPNAFTPQTSQADTSEINVIDHERSFSLDDQHFLKKTYRAVKDLIGGNKAFVLLGIIPFMTFGYYYAFKKKSIPVRLNGTETFFAQVYYSCQFLLVSLISLLITRQSQVYSPVDFSFKLFLIIQIWNNHQLYHISFIRSFKRTLIAIIYAFLFAIALITCFVLILRLFYSI